MVKTEKTIYQTIIVKPETKKEFQKYGEYKDTEDEIMKKILNKASKSKE